MKVHRSGQWQQAKGIWVRHQDAWITLALKQEWHWQGTGRYVPHQGDYLRGWFYFAEYLPGQMRKYTWMSVNHEWNGNYHLPCSGMIEDRYFNVTKELPRVGSPTGFVWEKWGYYWTFMEVGPFEEDPFI